MDGRGNVNTDNDKSCADRPLDKTPLQSAAWDGGPPTTATGTSTFTRVSETGHGNVDLAQRVL